MEKLRTWATGQRNLDSVSCYSENRLVQGDLQLPWLLKQLLLAICAWVRSPLAWAFSSVGAAWTCGFEKPEDTVP